MNWIEALILGIVQGLTEFLPVSSSGHLAIGNTILGISNTGSENLMFSLSVHAATVLSTIVALYQEIMKTFNGVLKFKYNDETKFALQIIISMIPVAIVGLFFKDYVEQLFENQIIFVGLALLVTAALLIMSQMVKKSDKEMSPMKAFIVGIVQAIAIIPGLSRSGSTIATGLLLGVKRETIARFSFLMVIVPILGESALEIIKGDFYANMGSIPFHVLLVGFIAAFTTGLFACKAMISIVKKAKLQYFAIYCLFLGIGVLLYSLL